MKIKSVKVTSCGTGINGLEFKNVNSANDHISWPWKITSGLSSNSTVYGATIYDSRTGYDKRGIFCTKLNLYTGSGSLDREGFLTISGPISSFDNHHLYEPTDPIIILSA